MKTNKLVNISLSIILMITLLASCKNKNYVNSTEVFSDGSCIKNMSVNGDSSVAFSQEFPVLINSTWEKNVEIVNKDEKVYKLEVTKHFKNVNDINLETPNDSDTWSKLEHSIELDKKFRWFYTYLTYKETYKKANPFELIPVTDYISRDELLILTGEYTEYLAGRDSAEIEKIRDQITSKAFTWIQASIFKEFSKTLISNIGVIGNPKVTAESINKNKDTVLTYLKLKEEDISDVLFEVDSMLTIYSICLNTNDFKKLSPSKSKAFDEYIEKGKKLELLFDMMADNAKSSVIMPGLLINSNCKTVIGNEIQWEFSPLKSFFGNYEISVTSRIINRWAFIVSAAFLIFLIAGLVIGAFIKRRR